MKNYTLKPYILTFFCAMLTIGASAQLTPISQIQLSETITHFDNAIFRMAYLGNDDTLYAFRRVPIVRTSSATTMAFNPAGSNIAVMYKKTTPIKFWSFLVRDKRIAQLKKDSKDKATNTAITYSPDAQYFVVATSDKQLKIFNTKDINEKAKEIAPAKTFTIDAPTSKMAVSSNNYFIVTQNGNTLKIWNFDTGKELAAIPFSKNVTGFCFSPDAGFLAVTQEGSVEIYETKKWSLADTFDQMGSTTKAPNFSHDGKYLTVVKNDIDAVVLNIKSRNIVQTIEFAEPLMASRFCFSQNTEKSYLILVTQNGFSFYNADGLAPLYGKVLDTKVSSLMNDWSKMAEGESMEDYKIRMSDENRAKQYQLFSQETATALAGDRLEMAKPFVGDYDASAGLLGISFAGTTLNNIALPVPAAEAATFAGDKMKFDNAVYVLGANDEFEIAYLEVTNETTGKTYIFDNIGRTKMSVMEAAMDFVPIDVIQQANQEELQLQTIKEEVVAQNKTDKLITDKTQINVKTEVLPDVNAEGQKILNYKIAYQYQVEKEFSASEDFPSGGYDVEKSPAAMAMVKIIKQAFETDFAKYLEQGKRIKIIITGAADASPIRGRINYSNKYGEFIEQPFYMNGELDNLTVTKTSGITENPQLAFIRAAAVKDAIQKNVTALQTTRNDYQYNVEVSNEVGGEHRRIKVDFVIVDAFPVK